MSITTRSQFFYGHTISEDNQWIDFDEGGSELSVQLDIGDYTLTEFAAELAAKMTQEGALTYTATINRATRKITLAAGSNFALRVTTGTHLATSAFSLVGFTSNKSGSSSYLADIESGSVYRPQAVFRDYVPFIDNNAAQSSVVNESESGIVETVSFGSKRIAQMNIWLITDKAQQSFSSTENNPNARAEARAFLEYATSKAKFEFMEDRATPATFDKVILEKTQESDKGTAYRLKKMFNNGVEGYYESGEIELRKVIE
jgi:hypothetical protein